MGEKGRHERRNHVRGTAWVGRLKRERTMKKRWFAGSYNACKLTRRATLIIPLNLMNANQPRTAATRVHPSEAWRIQNSRLYVGNVLTGDTMTDTLVYSPPCPWVTCLHAICRHLDSVVGFAPVFNAIDNFSYLHILQHRTPQLHKTSSCVKDCWEV